MKIHGWVLITLALFGTEIWGKGRIKEDRTIAEPTQFGEVLIAPGVIQVFVDNGEFASGLLAREQKIKGIVFPAGAQITVSDYPLSMNIHELNIMQTDYIKVDGLTLGNWIQLRTRDTELTHAFTYLEKDGHAIGLDLKASGYLSYTCSYGDCSQIARLNAFQVKNDTTILGFFVPAGSGVDFRLANVEFKLSRDVEYQGLPLSGGKEYGASLNQMGRVIQFVSSREFVYRGKIIPAENFVRLDHDGNIKQVGNTTFP